MTSKIIIQNDPGSCCEVKITGDNFGTTLRPGEKYETHVYGAQGNKLTLIEGQPVALTELKLMEQCRAEDKTAYGAAQREPDFRATMGFNAYQDRCVALALPQVDYRAVGIQRDGVGIKIASPELDWIYPALGLCGEAGEVAEKLKKVLRDDKGVMSEETKEAVKKELGDCAWYLAYLSHKLGFTLQEVAEANLKKLYARETKGTRRGSGDDR